MTHICVGKLTIIGSDNGLSPDRRQAIIWTNAGILLIGPLGTNFSEISSEIHTFSFKKKRLNKSSAKWRPFYLGLNVLTDISLGIDMQSRRLLSVIKSPRVTGGLLFLVRFHHRLRRRRRSANTFQLSGKTHEANFFKPHMVDLWVWENILAPISVTLGQGHSATEAGRNLSCPHDKVRTAHPIATKLGRYIRLIMPD